MNRQIVEVKQFSDKGYVQLRLSCGHVTTMGRSFWQAFPFWRQGKSMNCSACDGQFTQSEYEPRIEVHPDDLPDYEIVEDIMDEPDYSDLADGPTGFWPDNVWFW